MKFGFGRGFAQGGGAPLHCFRYDWSVGIDASRFQEEIIGVCGVCFGSGC